MLDTTIASPWAFKVPPLDNGVDIVVASGTKSLGGNDRDMWGYIATNDTQFANSVMDLIAMRGGILDWRRAAAIAASFDGAERRACAPLRDGIEGRGVPRLASRRSARCFIRRCRIIPIGGDRDALRAPRLDAVVPDRRTPTRIARGTSPTCSRLP